MKSKKPWVVLKFGGTSVSSVENWNTIARVVENRVSRGFSVLVTLSAVSGISNMLIELLDAALKKKHPALIDRIESVHLKLASDLGLDGDALLKPYFSDIEKMARGISLIQEASPYTHARLVSRGELMSSTLGTEYLKKMLPAMKIVLLDARTALKSAENGPENRKAEYLSASCDYTPDPALQERLAFNADITVTQGFIASNDKNETVLLGRGGSDTSASYFAARLQASELEIWTDVPGMFTTNPRLIPSARLLKNLSYEEAQEIASTGAKVLHPRCILPVMDYGIPLRIYSTQHPDLQGTLISRLTPTPGLVKAVSMQKDVLLFSMEALGMWRQSGFLADVFSCFKEYGLSIDMVSTSETNITVTLDPQSGMIDQELLDDLTRSLEKYCTVRIIKSCAAVSLVGHQIRASLYKLGPALKVFEEQEVHMVSQAANDLNLTFVISEDQAERTVQELHEILIMDHTEDNVLGITWENLLAKQKKISFDYSDRWWFPRRKELIALARQGPVYVYDQAFLDSSIAQLKALSAVSRCLYAMKANSNRQVLARIESAGLGFDCVSQGELEFLFGLFPGLDPKRILFTPNFAPRIEYEYALNKNVPITVDNLYPLSHWPELFSGKEVFVRIDPGIRRGHHDYVKTAGIHSKFGIPAFELPRLERLVKKHGIRVIGLHAHAGSGILIAEHWSEMAGVLAPIAEKFPEVRFLNLGGGLGLPERFGQLPLDLHAVNSSLQLVKKAYPQFELWLEPGRYLVAEAGILLARVTQLKGKAEMNYVGVETGMNSLIRPALYGAYHEIVNLSKISHPLEQAANIVGPICETGDRLGIQRLMPRTEEGDVLLIANAGAYGYMMSSHYNLREPAREYFLERPLL